jgi:lipopolysaccharide O-acetyltransferase
MIYHLIYLLIKIYTWLLSHQFHSFGRNSIIKPFLNTSNAKHISIGSRVNIGSFSRITVSTEYAGRKVHSQNKIRLKISNNVDIGNNSFITANNLIKIGHHCIISAYVFITDHEHLYQNVNLDLHHQPLSEDGKVIINDNVLVGSHSTILKNVTIGRHSIVGAGSVVTKDIPPYSVAAGNPAKIIKRYDHKSKKWISN